MFLAKEAVSSHCFR